jgi:hypothetical protein
VVFWWGRVAANGIFVGKCFPNLFGKLLRNPVSIWPVANARRQASPLFSLCPNRVRNVIHTQLSVCGCVAVKIQRPVVGPVVDRCGISCGNGRGWLRRSCGKTSSKPAASIVDQLLTNVYKSAGKARYADSGRDWDAALEHFQSARRIYLKAGGEAKWQAVVNVIQTEHSRKKGFLLGWV